MRNARIMKNCPECGQPLIDGVDAKTKEPLLVCETDGCKFKMPLPVDVVLRMQGAKALPGFE